ncbi:MAG TPA: glucose-1-phosphate adenylyltransferase [Bryobacteraceae bacterium]|jgi:glucose-1-phosphate adenylyltransferase|nr:glucose-1-phosphate adenylyltransferase [Bryobacteraceae bacterium]
MNNVLAILLAGGVGERLHPLTRDTAKPAVPFGGGYRIIDFTLSNCINSDIRRIFILTQYKALDLARHIRNGWNILSPEVGEYIEMIPPMKRLRDDWYLGTADAVFQNSEAIAAEDCKYTLILSGDQIYKMNYGDMLRWHHAQRADVTIASIQVPPEEATRFGICDIDLEYRIVGFEEKPQHGNPVRSRFNPGKVSASMGIYLFRTDVLLRALIEDAADSRSSHDFGHDVIPRLMKTTRVVAYNFVDMNAKEALYWRDVGTIDAYYEANMDLVSVSPEFNLYDERWPVRTGVTQQPPAKFVFAQEGRRMGVALDSIVCAGCVISGGRVVRSVLSPGVRVNSYCEIEYSILMPKVEIGRYSRIRRAIIDSGVRVPESTSIGYDLEADRAAGYTVTESGIVVVPSREYKVTQALPPAAGGAN